MRSIWRRLKYYRSFTGEVDIFENYIISSDGLVKNRKTKQVISIGKRNKYKYFVVMRNGKKSNLSLSIAICSSFNRCPKISGYVVDHIDRDISNNTVGNLRFSTVSNNLKNRTKVTNPRILIGYNLENNSIKIIETINLEKLTLINRNKLTKRVNYYAKSGGYKGLQWCLFQKESFDRLKSTKDFNKVLRDVVLYSNWIKCYSSKISDYFISELGIICRRNSYGINSYTFGNINMEGNDQDPSIRFHITFGDKGYLVSRLVAKYFINRGIDIDESLEVDHIDGDSSNNNVNNLKICSHTENMANPNTQTKLTNLRKKK